MVHYTRKVGLFLSLFTAFWFWAIQINSTQKSFLNFVKYSRSNCHSILGSFKNFWFWTLWSYCCLNGLFFTCWSKFLCRYLFVSPFPSKSRITISNLHCSAGGSTKKLVGLIASIVWQISKTGRADFKYCLANLKNW